MFRQIVGGAAMQDVFDAAMHEQIGVTSNWRRKVRVVRQRQTEVADVPRLIDRLWHRANHHGLDQTRLFAVGHLSQHAAEILRSKLAVARQGNTEAAQKLLQLIQAVLLGLAMHSIQSRNAVLLQKPRRFHIGGDHAFFDQTMRVVARVFDKGRDLTVGIEAYFQFRRIKVDGAAI